MLLTTKDFEQYYFYQSDLCSKDIIALDDTWTHSQVIKNLLSNVLSKLDEMALSCGITKTVSQKVNVPIYERRIEKYTNWVDVLRLANYQYGRFTEKKVSTTEGLYSTLLALASTYSSGRDLKIGILGCGAGRSVLDFCRAYPFSTVYGLDYSITALCLADNILGNNITSVNLVSRDVSSDDCISTVHEIIPFNLNNYKLGLWDIMNFDNTIQFDIIVCSNVLNLLPNQEIAIKNMANTLTCGGLLIYADLIGWRLDRKAQQKTLKSLQSIQKCFENIGFKTLELFKGGPYYEKESDENGHLYLENFYVGLFKP